MLLTASQLAKELKRDKSWPAKVLMLERDYPYQIVDGKKMFNLDDVKAFLKKQGHEFQDQKARKETTIKQLREELRFAKADRDLAISQVAQYAEAIEGIEEIMRRCKNVATIKMEVSCRIAWLTHYLEGQG